MLALGGGGVWRRGGRRGWAFDVRPNGAAMEQTAKLGSKVLIPSRNPLAFVCILPDEGLGWAEAWLVDVVGIALALIQHPATERIFPGDQFVRTCVQAAGVEESTRVAGADMTAEVGLAVPLAVEANTAHGAGVGVDDDVAHQRVDA
jgi:hypothetical protein